jgi:type II secretory pathway component PulK
MRLGNGRPLQVRRQQGVVLAIVLVMIFALITAVYAFQRRAIIDTTIAANRVSAAEADALAKGGLRIAEVIVAVVRSKQGSESTDAGSDTNDRDSPQPLDTPSVGTGGDVDALWQGLGDLPINLDESRSLRIQIENEGAKLNLNALVPPSPVAATDLPEGVDADDRERDEEDSGSSASDESVEYLTAALERIIDGMEDASPNSNYDPAAIAENILDFIDPDTTALDGRSEDEYYRRQEPPYAAWNRPLVSVDQLGLVEDVDPRLLEELRHYVTVHPIGSSAGIDLNRAEPWVLRLVYSGNSGNMRLIDDRFLEDLVTLQRDDKLVCDDVGADPRCVSRAEVGSGDLGDGSVYPAASLPARPAVFRVVSTARIGDITRRFEAIYDTRPNEGPQLLSWRRLRGAD